MLTHIQTAAEMLEVVQDPALTDAIRVLTTPSSPPSVVETAKNYVESSYELYCKLFFNTDRPTENGRFTPPDLGES